LDGLTPFYFNSGADTNTPKINNFFSDGIICGQVYSQGDWTLPAFSSMLTGVYPIKHGVYNPRVNEKVLPPNLKTLPELLNKSGYRTFCYSSHSRFSPAYGHARGFERFLYKKSSLLHDPNKPMESYHNIDNYTQIITETITHLEAHKGDNNFVFIHFFDTHHPYWPFNYFQHLSMDLFRDYYPSKSNVQDNGRGKEEYNAFITSLINSKLREVDLALDQLFSYCKKQNWYDNAYFILSADHGEKALLEDEGLLLSQSRVNIPLNVRGPDIKSARDHSLIEGNNDLFASLLHLGQVQSPSNTDGIIWPFIGGQKRNQVLSESLFVDKYQASIRTESHHYNWNAPFNQISMKINADESDKLKIYKRSNGKDTFNEVIDQNLENYFYKFLNEHIKNNID
jgi:arylsulfatase A-like enzyme